MLYDMLINLKTNKIYDIKRMKKKGEKKKGKEEYLYT